MCGIAGFNFPDKDLIAKMNDALKHRGPDAEGTYVDERVSLGHRRLSILDLSENGNQPMSYKDYVITYNGEIYNYEAIREELKLLDHEFVTQTDTEVILHAYEEWGPDCVNRFNGMWAFCIYEKTRQRLFLSRDRFGIKPVYYYWDKKHFIFASEIKAIRQHELDLSINVRAVNRYFYQKYIGGEDTIFSSIYKLRPAENLTFDLNTNELEIQKYYDLAHEMEKASEIPVKNRIDRIEDITQDAVKIRLISDVPVGSFLSGGVDSSVISAIISRLKPEFQTFSIGFAAKSYDETEYSAIVADHIGTNHNIRILDIDQDLILQVLQNLDEPFGDSSLIPTYLLSQITREKVTVSLSGDAGDEIFAGYDSYLAHKIAKFIPTFAIDLARHIVHLLPVSEKKLSLAFKIRKFINDYDPDPITRHFRWMSQMESATRRALLGDKFVHDDELIDTRHGQDWLSTVQLADISTYLAEDILKKVDIASMQNSLEVRVPFLDYRLVPLVLSLPENYKIRRFKTKWLLKRIASNYLPSRIINRKKRGFTVPLSKWIKENSLIQEYLLEESYYTHRLLEPVAVKRIYNEHICDRIDHSRALWLIFTFNYWWHLNNDDISV